MSKKNFTEQVLETIKKKGIRPKPRWEFLLKDYFLWAITFLAMLIGGFAFSVIIYMFKNNDWDIYKYMDDSLLGFIFGTLPYFWILFLVIFIVAGYYNFKHTKKGYKCHVYLMIVISILVSVFFGTILYDAGVGQAIDNVLSERMPFYSKLINNRMARWSRIDKGMMAGIITSVHELDGQHCCVVEDFNGKEWNINNSEAIMIKEVDVIIGNCIRIIGERIDENNFKARIIAPGGPLGKHPMFKLDFQKPERKFLNLRIKK